MDHQPRRPRSSRRVNITKCRIYGPNGEYAQVKGVLTDPEIHNADLQRLATRAIVEAGGAPRWALLNVFRYQCIDDDGTATPMAEINLVV